MASKRVVEEAMAEAGAEELMRTSPGVVVGAAAVVVEKWVAGKAVRVVA